MKIDVDKADLRNLYLLLEEIQGFLHHPLNYEDSDNVKKFADKTYDSVHKMYYETVWNWLPEKMQAEITER